MTNNENKHKKFYFGTAETTFKEQSRNHCRDIKHKMCQYNTEVAKYNWPLKKENVTYHIKWTTISNTCGNVNSLRSKFCLGEKFWIAKHFNNINLFNLLNKKLGLINKWQHSNKMLLKEVKWNEHSLILIASLVYVYIFYILYNFLFFI